MPRRVEVQSECGTIYETQNRFPRDFHTAETHFAICWSPNWLSHTARRVSAFNLGDYVTSNPKIIIKQTKTFLVSIFLPAVRNQHTWGEISAKSFSRFSSRTSVSLLFFFCFIVAEIFSVSIFFFLFCVFFKGWEEWSMLVCRFPIFRLTTQFLTFFFFAMLTS